MRSSRLILAAFALAACVRPVRELPAPQPSPATSPAAERFADDIARFEAADRLSPPRPNGVLFVGSSSIRLWPALQADFPCADVVQRGFGGSELGDVARYAARVVLPHRPRLVVVYAGDNDLAAGKTPAALFADYQALVSIIHRSLPATRIAFVAIKPSGSRWQWVEQMRAANALVRRHAATDPRLVFVDVFTPMLGADGLPREELFVADRLHMSTRGYALWRDLLLPVVCEAAP